MILARNKRMLRMYPRARPESSSEFNYISNEEFFKRHGVKVTEA